MSSLERVILPFPDGGVAELCLAAGTRDADAEPVLFHHGLEHPGRHLARQERTS